MSTAAPSGAKRTSRVADRPRLFVELCCGSAAVTLKLLGGRYAVPPISYMGSKRGYAIAILGAMGLRSGIGADAVLLCDAGPWAHVWSVLADPARCGEVATILRGWADEEPRELWERLREEHRGEWDGWTSERAAAFLQINAFNRLINVDRNAAGEWKNTGIGGTTFGGDEFATPAGETAQKVTDVAAWLQRSAWSYEAGNLKKGFVGPGDRRQDTSSTATATATAGGVIRRGGVSLYAGSAEAIEPPDDCDGVVVYIDPPYQGTTGYSATMPRETVLDTARKWSDAGAIVCVSEAEPLPLDGWHHVEITSARQGQKRTFSKQQAEWLTISREPAHVPATQADLFA